MLPLLAAGIGSIKQGEKKSCSFVGSLRAAAWSRKVAQALITLAPHSLKLEIVEIDNCRFTIGESIWRAGSPIADEGR